MGWFDSILDKGLNWGANQILGSVNWGPGTTVGGSSSGSGSTSFLPSLIGAVATAYTGYKSYESQKDASELQYEAAQSQVKAAGFQEEAAAKQEMAALESQRLAEMNAIDSELQTARDIESTRFAQEAESSEARARAAASGFVSSSGSIGAFIDKKNEVFGQELDWMAKAGASSAANIRKQGETAKLTGQAQADSTRAQAASTRAGASATESQAKGTTAGAYGTAGSTVNTLYNIGKQSNWF